jgi:hypothetical protein
MSIAGMMSGGMGMMGPGMGMVHHGVMSKPYP